jgi:DNA-binding transcriptional LysR family regulator
MDDELFPVASPRLAGLDEVHEAADIARLPLIGDLARQGWHDWFRAMDVHGATLDERHVFSDSTDALQAAVYGLGAALARRRISAPYLADGRLIQLPGASITARWGYYLVHPAHRKLKPAARAFVDWLLAETESERA